MSSEEVRSTAPGPDQLKPVERQALYKELAQSLKWFSKVLLTRENCQGVDPRSMERGVQICKRGSFCFF